MWNLENRAAFRACVADLLNNPEVQKMREVRQHVQDANCLQHCLFVAYLSFCSAGNFIWMLLRRRAAVCCMIYICMIGGHTRAIT